MTDIITAILAVRKAQDGGHARVGVSGEDINRITWHDDNPTNITNQQITDKQAELQVEYDAKQYQRDRRFKYPSWQDQMDMQYHDLVNDTSTWEDAVQAVKDQYPKP